VSDTEFRHLSYTTGFLLSFHFKMPIQTFLFSEMQRSPAKPTSPVQSHRVNVGKDSYNRFAILAGGGDPGQSRIPSAAKRRRNLDSDQETPGKQPRLDSNKVFDQLKVHDTILNTAKNALAEAGSVAAKVGAVDDSTIGTVLYKFGQVMDSLISGQESLKSAVIDLLKVRENKNHLKAPENQLKSGTGQNRTKSSSEGKQNRAQPTKEEVEKAKIKKVLREAERRVIAFDLDLGGAPIVNKTTISKIVTLDLHKRVKSGNHDWAVDSAATMVDDMLSCSQLEFLGSGTKRYYNNQNPNDERTNKMCTVPVCFDFKTKEQRIRAEVALKKVCKVRTSVPYPKKVRDALAELVEAGKKKAPGKYIMTKVEIEKLSISAYVRGEKGWIDLDLKKDIASLLIDTNGIEVSDTEVFSNASEEIEIS